MTSPKNTSEETMLIYGILLAIIITFLVAVLILNARSAKEYQYRHEWREGVMAEPKKRRGGTRAQRKRSP